jgi:hypothetical protein
MLEEGFVLRLSIIVPYRQDDASLEATLLSLLENQPPASELIVVHDGSYRDPYQLAGELTLIEFDRGTPVVAMLNEACHRSHAPNICTLLPGVTVSEGWADEPIQALEYEGVDAVAVPVQRGRRSGYGMSRKALGQVAKFRSGELELYQPRGECAGPLLACGFFSRDSLLAIGGWNDGLVETAAEAEMALLLSEADWDIHCATESTVIAPPQTAMSSLAIKQLAHLAVCYDLAEQPSTVGRGIELAVGCLSGRLTPTLAWLTGLKPTTEIRQSLLQRKLTAAQLSDLPAQTLESSARGRIELPDQQVWRRAA